MDSIWQDIRFAARTLLRNRGFALAAVLTVALGIGGSTAIFSVVDTVLLRPLPFGDGERLVRVFQTGYIYHYACVMILGVLGFLIYFLPFWHA